MADPADAVDQHAFILLIESSVDRGGFDGWLPVRIKLTKSGPGGPTPQAPRPFKARAHYTGSLLSCSLHGALLDNCCISSYQIRAPPTSSFHSTTEMPPALTVTPRSEPPFPDFNASSSPWAFSVKSCLPFVINAMVGLLFFHSRCLHTSYVVGSIQFVTDPSR